MKSNLSINFGQFWALALIVAFAVGMRCWGTSYGLPFSYWADEYHEVMRALELGAGGFNFDRTSKGGFYLFLFLEYGLYYVFLKSVNVVSTTREFAELFVTDPSAFYLMGRVTAALIGSATVLGVYCSARVAFSNLAGLFAALLLAVNVLHIDLSRRIGVDVPMAMLATWTLYYAIRIARAGRSFDYVAAAVLGALAATTKITGILLVMPLFLAHVYAMRVAGGGVRQAVTSPRLWWAVLLFAAVLIATNPGIVSASGYLTLFIEAPVDLAELGSDEAHGETDHRMPPSLYVFYLASLAESMGWPLFVVALISVIYAAWKRTPTDVLLLSYALVNYLAIAGTSSNVLYYPRYLLPIVVSLSILSGRALADAVQVLGRHQRVALVALLAACIAMPLGHAIASARVLTRTDIRTIAKAWIEANIPAGSKILVEGGKIAADRATVPLRDKAESVRKRIEYWSRVEPRQATLLKLQLATHRGGGYDLELLDHEAVESLDDYAEKGVKYFVVRPDYFMGARRANAASARFLRELRSDRRVSMIKRFPADERSRLGPTVEIYRLSLTDGEAL